MKPEKEDYSFEKKILDKLNEDLDNKLESIPHEKIEVSKRHKIKMNRIFREVAGCPDIPFPEVDNIFERIRGKIFYMLNKVKKFQKD